MASFRDYTKDAAKQITFIKGDLYPDALEAAITIFKPVLDKFGAILAQSADSCDLLNRINNVTNTKQRTQLLRVFRKYVSPDTSVEMLKKKTAIPQICRDFGDRFRPLPEVVKGWKSRPVPDEAIIAILNEYKDRGQKGYGLTGDFFEWFENTYADKFTIEGPAGAGSDINLASVLPGYPKDRRPVDFIIKEIGHHTPIIVGLARYDSDRGGAQEDDRTSGYRNVVTELMTYADGRGMKNLKLLFINDGPGLLLGSMWKDYCEIEDMRPGRVMVATLKMLKDRVTEAWLRS